MESREELLENIAHLVSENRRLTADRDLYRDLWHKGGERRCARSAIRGRTCRGARRGRKS